MRTLSALTAPNRRLLLLASAAAFGPSWAQGSVLTVGGSTLAQSAMTGLLGQFAAGTPYQRLGSAAGVAGVRDGSLAIGLTDWPLTSVELAQGGLLQVPLFADSLVLAYNLPGFGALKLPIDLLVEMFAGRLNSWRSGTLARVNPDLKFTGAVSPVVRSDSAGSTRVFTNALSGLSRSWSREFGSDFTVRWSSTATAVRGTTAVVDAIQKTPGSIGYLGAAEASAAKLFVASVSNSAGQFILPGSASVSSALASARWSEANLEPDVVRAPSPQAWPMTAVVYAVIKAKAPTTVAAKALIAQVLSQGQPVIARAGFVEVPAVGKALAAKVLGI